VCTQGDLPAADSPGREPPDTARDAGIVESDFGRLQDGAGLERATPAGPFVDGPPVPGAPATGSDRAVGTLVHRLVQLEGVDADEARLRATAEALLVADRAMGDEAAADASAVGEPAFLVERAVSACRALWTRPDIRELYQSGQAYHEVPFTLRLDGRIVRGAMDCLIVTAEGAVTVLELKTGRARPEHENQLDVYRQAAAALFPGAVVDARLVYTADPRGDDASGQALTPQFT
jgi:ATP-dependent exoDNAse (exonuclease V) beta subunit